MKLFDKLTNLRESVVDWLTGRDRAAMEAESEDLSNKLAGWSWRNDLSDDSMQENVQEPEGKDIFADAVFRGRPSNPLSDDF